MLLALLIPDGGTWFLFASSVITMLFVVVGFFCLFLRPHSSSSVYRQDLLLGALHQPVGDVDAGMHKLQDVTTPPMGSPQHAETPGAPQEV